MRKIILSLVTIAGVIALGIGASQAFFSDTETSTGNTFVAGAVDLKIDSKCSYNGQASNQCGTWDPTNLTNQKFFNFSDLKPGDYGENTISMDLTSNPANACVIIENMHDDDNGLNEPESEDGDTTGGLDQGELASQLHFFTWADDGDNVWENSEQPLFSNVSGPASDVLDGKTYNLGLMQPGSKYIGVYWCYGTLTVNQGNNSLSCNGSSANNITQTDSLTADIRFYVEQARNNANFQCPAPVNSGRTIEVRPNDLAQNIGDVANNPSKWFFYNDDNDTIDNSLGSFVAGPATPPNGSGSAQFTLAASPFSRKNIATYQFSGKPLSSIISMSFGAYSHGGSGGAGPNESPYLHFNVDFNGSDTWQSRLVYVPSANGSVPQDTWNTYNVIQGGAAKWVYSGAVWPTPLVGPHAGMVGVSGTTPRTWDEILADYPGVRVRATDSWLGIRVGEPGPTGYTGNVDFFAVGTSGGTTTYNFE